MKTKWLTFVCASFALTWLNSESCFGIDLQLLSAYYNQNQYVGYPVAGTFNIELSKDNYTFQPSQFELNISLPAQGKYDATRAAQAVIPAGWELIVNDAQSLVIRATEPYAGTGESQNRKRNFSIPIITSGAAVDQPSNVLIDWKDILTAEAPAANSIASSLNVSSVPLPVTLATFTAKKEGQTSLLNWTTTEEENSEKFNVEHSLNGKTWNEIGSVASKGESTTLQRYNFTHQNPSNGDNLYRLKMIDRDGTFAYSSIQVLKFEGIQDIALVYPNPASDVVKVNAKDFGQVKGVRMYDLNGRSVYSASGRAVSQQIDIKSMAPGSYIVEITKISGEIKSTKIVIVR